MVGETSHARSRHAALLGLVLQVLAAGGTATLAYFVHSHAMVQLAWYIGAGIPIWFVALLVFRQRELAALEAMDLEELRREKRATGGGEAMFDAEGGGGLGFLVAKTRLEWMQRWLIPIFGLLSAGMLIGIGVWDWLILSTLDPARWGALLDVPIGMIILAVITLFLFFLSRYTAGMGRVPEWQLLRGCGSYMLGNAIVAGAILVALAAGLYLKTSGWERYVALAIPVFMVLLGIETLLNFILDVYRPRSPNVEPRACFDSRLLGLISEPGGIAHSLAEAMNYQFGFQVSQTWFYQLLQKTLTPLIGAGIIAVWLLTCLVIVYPYEHSIREVFGRQEDPEHPLGPGFYFKWPIGASVAPKYNTGQLHEFVIGFQSGDTPIHKDHDDHKRFDVELWTDQEHAGHKHFDFVISPPPKKEEEEKESTAESLRKTAEAKARASVNLVRMAVHVQYRIRPEQLDKYTQTAEDPDWLVRRIAWNEVLRYNATSYLDELMGAKRQEIGPELQERIADRCDAMNLGLEIVYVGVQQIHPEKTVAEAFRGVVNAGLEKLALIRKARVEENKMLSEVAGGRDKAVALADALDQLELIEARIGDAERKLASQGVPDADKAGASLDEFAPLRRARIEAQVTLAETRAEHERIQQDFDLGLGQSRSRIADSQTRVDAAEKLAADAGEAAKSAQAGAIAALTSSIGEEAAGLLSDRVEAKSEQVFWNERLERNLVDLGGQAAVTLAQAQAQRWQTEMKWAGQVTRLQKARVAYHAAPRIYKIRSYLDVWVDGLKGVRKYFLAFNPNGRTVHVRLEAQEEVRPEMIDALTGPSAP